MGHLGLTPGFDPWVWHGNPLQYSCLKNPMDQGAWWALYNPWGHKESDTTEQLTLPHTFCAYTSLSKLIS